MSEILDDILEGVTWFKMSSLRIRRAGLEIYVDPWGLREDGSADYVLLTHPHFDNFSEEDIARVRTDDTVLIAPATMKKQIGGVDHLLRPGDLLQLEGIDVLAVPAYNEDRRYHPAESGWLGYVFTVGETTFYHAGHTDLLDSLERVRCDVAFIPCDARYMMSTGDAGRAAAACGADVLVPIHRGEGEPATEAANRIRRHFDGRLVFLEQASETRDEGVADEVPE